MKQHAKSRKGGRAMLDRLDRDGYSWTLCCWLIYMMVGCILFVPHTQAAVVLFAGGSILKRLLLRVLARR